MNRRERITFEEETVTYNDYNEEITSWSEIGTTPSMWAKAIPKTSNEDHRDNQKSGFQRYNFNILHRNDLDIQMRIRWDGRYWDIKAVETLHKEPRNKELLITAEWTQGKYE